MTLTAEPKTARAPKTPRPPKAAKPPKEPRTPKTRGPKGKAAAPAILEPKEATWPSPVKPSLMLLPPKIAGRRMHQHAVKRAWLVAAAMLGLTAVLYIPVTAAAGAAQADLDAATQESQDHRDYLSANAGVQSYYDGLVLRKQAVAETLVKDVSYAEVIKAVNDANHAGATFSQISVKPAKAKATTGQPFSASKAVGYLDLAGSAPSVQAVGQLVAGLQASKDMLTDAYVVESAVTKSGTQFKISVGYTEKAMSFKGEPFRPKPEELAAVAAEAADEAAAAADESTQEDSK